MPPFGPRKDTTACVIFRIMEMSRRQFFRGLRGKDRAAAVDAYVRDNLLPYDFSITDEQVEHLLRVARSALAGGEGSHFSSEERQRMAAIAQETIAAWREEYLKAEEKRREAVIFVREFIQTKGAPASLEGTAVSWLYKLPDARLAALNAAELKELVFSQMAAWCPPDR
jgi:hypothetical protein